MKYLEFDDDQYIEAIEDLKLKFKSKKDNSSILTMDMLSKLCTSYCSYKNTGNFRLDYDDFCIFVNHTTGKFRFGDWMPLEINTLYQLQTLYYTFTDVKLDVSVLKNLTKL